MGSHIEFFGTTGFIEAKLLLASFVLCSLIGFERQFRQKSAGYRTHVLVGIGTCVFTLVSAYGFAGVLENDVRLDPSRIAAQIVSGIGFLGAGVIFKGRNMVRGLTTAATIWVTAAVGMACGAGMVSLAVMLTTLHLLTLFVIAPLIKRIPDSDHRKLLRITYQDGSGILRDILAVASTMGFANTIVDSKRFENEDGVRMVQIDGKFEGKPPLHLLIPQLMELEGVDKVSMREDQVHSVDEDGDTV
ncbi:MULTISPECIES: MgtC/SapB family protein [unclassified Brevibacterium]|uniref:MgtC/SapB family protein n=1 Tax=unclassified Brevibacterium TaxID=2614124 RepID=UPI000C4021CF|nr:MULTISPECIES: MgtC/SapB family protein [unclassified Brevibacterium]SMX68138.1 putative Mg2+ transporter-C (MgtC) family protein [Brevibacterium sp. 239c]